MATFRSGNPGLFIPGPTNVPDAVRQALNVPMQDMRAPDFGDLTLPLFADLKKVFKTTSATVFLFPASGTGGWEATIANLLSRSDRVLTASFGQFSMLWADLARRWGLDVQNIDCEWGEAVPLAAYRRALEADKAHRIKAVFACHNETATGVTSDLRAIGAMLKELNHPALLCVDSVSGLAAIDLRMDEWGIDVVVSGSQKGLMLPTGLCVMAVSARALAQRSQADLPRSFFSFDDMLKHNATGHFPYTPATTLFHGLRASLDLLFAEGLENVFARHQRLASAVRAAVLAWGESCPGVRLCARDPQSYSNSVTTVMLPEGYDARLVLDSAYRKFATSFGSGLGCLNGRAFRIGHLGSFNEIMALQAVATAELAMADAGVPIALGSGVAAAQRSFLTPKAAELRLAA